MRSEKREDGHQLNNWKKDYEGLVVLRLNNYLIYAHYVIRFFIIKAYYLIRQAYRGKYFANSRPFRGGRVSINVINLIQFGMVAHASTMTYFVSGDLLFPDFVGIIRWMVLSLTVVWCYYPKLITKQNKCKFVM